MRTRLRASLAITTAIAGLCVSGVAPAQIVPLPTPVPLPIPLPVPPPPTPPALPVVPPPPALPVPPQTLPNDVIRTVVSGEVGAAAPVIARAGQTLNVGVRAVSTVIDWKAFNVAERGTANFLDSRLIGGSQVAVLNRDLSGNPSQILGRLNAASNVSVWILNGSGILVGRGAVISTGSLVLSTLDIPNADFLSGAGGNYRLTAADPGSLSKITVAPGAMVSVTGTNRGLVLLAPSINANGIFTAGTADVAFVTASDVTLSYQAGSPLSVVIDKGTAVGGQAQVVGGSVSGRNALFALATQGSVTDSLLRVDASVTTAAAGTRGIILSAGAVGANAAGLLVRGDAAATGGKASLSASGALTSQGASADVVALTTGAATVTGALRSGRDTLVASGASTFVTGAVTAGRDFGVSGADVTLGGTVPVAQRANGKVVITAMQGSIFGMKDLTIQANADAIGTESLDLTASGATGGILFALRSTLLGGGGRESDVRLRTGSSDALVTLGTVDARGLLGAVGSDGFTTGLRRTSALVVGDLRLTGPVLLEAAGISAGAIATGSTVRLASTGALTATGIDAPGSIILTGTGSTSVTGVIRSGSAIAIDRDGKAVLGELRAPGDIVIGAGVAPASLEIGPVTTGGALRLNADGAIKLTGDASGRTLTVRGGSVSLAAGGTYTSAGSIDLSASKGGLFAGYGATVRSTSTSALDSIRLQADGADGMQFDGVSRIVGGADRNLAVGVRVGAGAPLLLGAVDARALVGVTGVDGTVGSDAIVASGPIGFRALNLRDTFRATASTGDLRVDAISIDGTGQGIELRAANGLLTAPSTLTADGKIVLESGAALKLGTVTSRSGALSVASGGAVSATSLTGAGDVGVSGSALEIGGATSGGALRLNADGAIRLTGDASGKTLSVRGGSISLAAGGTYTSAGSIDLSASKGGLFAGYGATVNSTSTSALDSIRLQADGADGIQFDGVSRIVGGADRNLAVGVRVGAGAPLLLGAVDARALVGVTGVDGAVGSAAIVAGGPIGFRALNLRDTFRATASTGDLRVDAISVDGAGQGIELRAANGILTAPSTLMADGSIVLESGAALKLGTVASASGAVSVASAGALTAATLYGLGDVLATGGSLDIGSATSGAAVRLTSPGAIRLTGDASGRALSFRGGTVALGAGATYTSAGSIDVTGTTGVTAGAGTTLRSVSTTSTDSIRIQGLGADGIVFDGTSRIIGGVDRNASVGVRVGAGAPLLLGAVDARALVGVTGVDGAVGSDAIVAGGPIGFRALNLRDTFRATASTGDLRVDTISVDGAGQGIELRAANGVLTAQSTLAADGAVVLESGADLGLVSVTSRSGSVAVTSAGAISASVLSGAGGVAASGRSLDIGSAIGGNIDLVATGGSLRTGTIDGRDVTLRASGDAAVGGVRAKGNYALTASGVTLGGAQAADGAVAIRATTGDIIGTSGLVLTADADGAGGEGLGLEATGAVKLALDTRLSGGPARGASVGIVSGVGLTLGAVDARALTVAGAASSGAITTGDLSLTDTLALTGAGGLRTGNITIRNGGVQLDSGTAALATGSVTASGLARLAGLQVNFTRIIAGGVDIATGDGGVAGDAITSTGNIALTAGSGGIGVDTIDAAGALAITSAGGIGLGAAKAGGDAALTATGTGSAIVIARGLNAGGTARLTSSGAIRTPFITTGGDLFVTAAGDLTGVDPATTTTLSVGQGRTLAVDVGGALRLGALTGGGLTLRGATLELGAIDMGSGLVDIAARTGDLSIGGAVRGGTVTLSAGGLLTMKDIAASGALTLAGGSGLIFGDAAGAGVTATSGSGLSGRSITSSNGAIVKAAAGLSLGTLTTSVGDGALTAGGDAMLGMATVAGNLSLLADGAMTATGPVGTGGALTFRGATVALGAGPVRAGGLLSVVTTRQAITGTTGLALAGNGVSLKSATGIVLGGTSIDARGGALGLAAGTGQMMTLGTVSAGSLGTVDASGTVADTLTHDGALTIGSASLNRLAVALGANAFSAGTLTVADAARIAGGSVAVDRVTAGSLAATATREATIGIATVRGDLQLGGLTVSLGEGRVGGAALIEAIGLARLGSLSAGPSITLRAGDAELTGTQRAGAITIQNAAAATRVLRIGDGLADAGFRLSEAEVGLLEADSLTLDGATGTVELGKLAFDADAGRRRVDVLGTGTMTVTGTVTGTGAGRAFRLGGTSASDGAGATDLRVAATESGGGRLLFDGADLELRANRIAVGLTTGFLDGLSGADAGARAVTMVGNSNSALYNANLGGGYYAASAPTTVSARSLTVRYGEFALFQNTAPAGLTSGVVLGGTIAAPVQPALTLLPTTAANSFALFGTVNGISGTSTALLGGDVLSAKTANMTNTRINGCLIGSGGGCLRTVVIQPKLQVFDQSREEVFGMASDLTVPFDPLIGGNNEDYLVDLETLDIDLSPVNAALPVSIDSALPPPPSAATPLAPPAGKTGE